MAILKKGLVQVYTGKGKGKTTAAFGLALRMLGAAGRVYICQFLKPPDLVTGESQLAEDFAENLTLERVEQEWDMRTSLSDPQKVEQMRQAIAEKLSQIKHLVREGKYDLVILDEIVFCLSENLADWEDVTTIISNRAQHVELVLTGRGADQKLIELADLVTEMQPVKHPWHQGVGARKGIEY